MKGPRIPEQMTISEGALAKKKENPSLSFYFSCKIESKIIENLDRELEEAFLCPLYGKLLKLNSII